MTVRLDANGHRRRETRDAFGRLIEVNEYLGVYPGCTTDVEAPYATTRYAMDVLGNLTRVTDAAGNITRMTYDSLSRKIGMTDPDMGTWRYVYDAVGNLTRQTDAKQQVIFFQYDKLSRLRQKDYGAQKTLGSGDVVYTYDELGHRNANGRLTSVVDTSGSSRFHYDVLGRTAETNKTVGGSIYMTQTDYDLAGRVKTLIYPNQDIYRSRQPGDPCHTSASVPVSLLRSTLTIMAT